MPQEGHSVDPVRDRPNIRPSYIIGTAMPREKPQTGDEVLEKPKEKTKRPEMFKVVLLNDDYTTMEFVVLVLQQVFNKPEPEAFRIMMQVHIKGPRDLRRVYVRDRGDEGRHRPRDGAGERLPAPGHHRGRLTGRPHETRLRRRDRNRPGRRGRGGGRVRAGRPPPRTHHVRAHLPHEGRADGVRGLGAEEGLE
jgi:hypothetical protein